MNQYITEQALLYINKPKSEDTPEIAEGPTEKIVQKSKRSLRRPPSLPSVLAGVLSSVCGQRILRGYLSDRPKLK